jgi:ketosteroid isomerase-like protein
MKSGRSALLWLVLLLVLGSTAACWRQGVRDGRIEQQRLALARAVEAEANIRAATIEWSVASKAKDVDKAVSFYADDAIEFVDKAPAAVGKANIRKVWQAMLTLPGPGLTFATTEVEVAHSGEIAWEHGTYNLATAEKDGKVTDEKGKYVVVWKKQFDGSWKVVADIDNTDQGTR